jgi:polyphosphate glucokinase
VPGKILVVDIGGSHVKCALSGLAQRARFPSGPGMTPAVMIRELRTITSGWQFDAVTFGYPGVVKHDQVVQEPHNLGAGWVGFDFQPAFGTTPIRVINDAAMQALGAYRGGRMLFIGLGTGLGSALVYDAFIIPLELARLPYQDGTYESAVSAAARRQVGQDVWAKAVQRIVRVLRDAFLPDEVVIGGGNARHIARLPPRTRRGSNADAFAGGFRLWDRE